MLRSKNKLWQKNCCGNTRELKYWKDMLKVETLQKKTKNIANNCIGNKTEGRRRDTKDIMKSWSGDGICWLGKYSQENMLKGNTLWRINVKIKRYVQGNIRREGKYSGGEHWGIIHWKIKWSGWKSHSELEDILKEKIIRRKKGTMEDKSTLHRKYAKLMLEIALQGKRS